MNLLKFAGGTVAFEVCSADFEASINAVNNAGIPLYCLKQKDKLTIQFIVSRKHRSAAVALFQKRGDTVKEIERKGIYWKVRDMIHRPLLLAGILGLSVFLLFLPTRILFVQPEGNLRLSDQEIITAAESCGVRFGASRRDVRSEKVKNALLSELPELQWAGINTKGCVAFIHVRERTDKQSEEQEERAHIRSIVADRDGIITSYTVLKGNILCSIGQAVQKGQMLVSAYTNHGRCIHYVQADGEIFAQTDHHQTLAVPTACYAKQDVISSKQKITFLIGKKRINLWKDSGICDATCDRIYKEYYITLPGGYQLPIGIGIEKNSTYQLDPLLLQQETLASSIEDYADRYLNQQMISGQIITSSGFYTEAHDVIFFDKDYVCTELISRVQKEQIGELNGENN